MSAPRKRKPRKQAPDLAVGAAILARKVEAELEPAAAAKVVLNINKATIARAVGHEHDYRAGKGSGQSNAQARRALKIKQLREGTYVSPTVARERTVASAEAAWAFTARMRLVQTCIREVADDLKTLDIEMNRLTYRADDADQMQEVATHLGALQAAIGDLRRVRRERMDAQASRIIERAGAHHAV